MGERMTGEYNSIEKKIEKENNRIEWVDVYKGIAILLVVIGHSASPVNGLIYAFHMAAFFFISGYTSNIDKKRVSDVILSKYYSLKIPLYVVFFFFLIISYILNYFGLFSLFFDYPFPGFFKSIDLLFKGTNTFNLMGATWFLIVLFVVFILQKTVIRLCNDRVNLLYATISTLLFIFGHLLINIGYRSNYWMIDLALVAQFFFFIGVVTHYFNLFEKIQRNWKIKWLIALIAGIGLYYFSFIHYAGADYPSRQFNNPFFNLLSSLCGIYLTYFLSIIILRINLLKKQFLLLGKNTLGILFFHFLFFKFLFAVLVIGGRAPIEYLRRLVPLEHNHFWFVLAISSVYLSAGAWKLILRIHGMKTLLGQNKLLYRKVYNWLTNHNTTERS